MRCIAMKFGGSSVADAAAMNKVLNIVGASVSRAPIVILSACKGVTDTLFECARLAGFNRFEQASALVDSIETKHITICKEAINYEKILSEAFKRVTELCDRLREFLRGMSILGENTSRSLDEVYSYGEILSTSVFNYICLDKGLKSTFLDARTIIKTDSTFNCAKPDFDKISINANEYFSRIFEGSDVVVTQGFIGSDSRGATTTLGRGGSDYSAAIFGAAVGAQEIQIWSDVSGVLTADPRVIDGTKTVKQMSVGEIRDLAYFGAKVLHPDTIIPAMRANIPVLALNTFQPDNSGTVIKADILENNLKSVLVKKGVFMIKFNNENKSQFVSYINSKISVLEQRDMKILFMSASTDDCILVADPGEITLESCAAALNNKAEISQVDLLCAVGGKNDPTAKLVLNKVLLQYSPIFTFSGPEGNSVVFVISQDNSLKAYQTAHNCILKYC